MLDKRDIYMGIKTEKLSDSCISKFFIPGTCPVCKNKAKGVSPVTLFHIIQKNYQKQISSLSGFYFCKTMDCEVIYFKGNELIKQDKLIKEVGLKKWASATTVCYCFNWTKEKIEEEFNAFGKTNALEDINSKMRMDKCNCEINNPSGKCCLKDIKETIKDINTTL